MEQNQRSRALGPALALALVLLLGALYALIYFSDEKPPFADLKGSPLSEPMLSDACGKKACLFAVWATWCAPCVRELPELQDLEPRLRARGLHLILVNVDEGPRTDVQSWMKEQKISLPTLHDPEGKTLAALKVRALPFAFETNAEQKILWLGEGDAWLERYRK